jgi:hypothetical protein
MVAMFGPVDAFGHAFLTPGPAPRVLANPDPCRMAHIEDVFQDVTDGTTMATSKRAVGVPAPSLNGSELQKTP